MVRPRPMVHAAVLYTLDEAGPTPIKAIYNRCREVLGVSEVEMKETRPDSTDPVFNHEVRCSLWTLDNEGKVKQCMFESWMLTSK